jgi:hypothetical protein
MVVVADGSRCRIFGLVNVSAPRSPWILEEIQDVVWPEGRLRQHERYSGSSPEGVRAGHSGTSHSFDDHRGAHDLQDRTRFVERAADTIQSAASERHCTRCIIVATHSVASILREKLTQRVSSTPQLDWLTAELTQLTPRELLHDLTRRGLIASKFTEPVAS